MGGLALCNLKFEEAAAFVRMHHRHHTPPTGHKFSLGARLAIYPEPEYSVGYPLVGVVIVGRPVSRMRDDGDTLEVTRLTTDGTRNACSFLYGAAARATFALGYRRIGTYILTSEPGTSLRAAGWKLIGMRGGGSWRREAKSHWVGRGASGRGAFPEQQKQLFEMVAS